MTLILTISEGGVKFTPVLVFKGKTDKNNEKRYNTLKVVKDKRILIYFRDNGWINDFIFKKWIDIIYLDYQNNIKKNVYYD